MILRCDVTQREDVQKSSIKKQENQPGKMALEILAVVVLPAATDEDDGDLGYNAATDT